ncbi:HU family DNA-binding protein [Candidatus Jidaibacter acanthamoebae]|nr:HU family DNA-binding protein [Candidatus Jidaibacter acanthamoeba]
MDKVLYKKDVVTWLKRFNRDLPLFKLEEIANIFFQEISVALICGDRIELRGFGSMSVKKRAAKVGRNPRTNQQLEVGNKGSLQFRPSKELLKKLNTLKKPANSA